MFFKKKKNEEFNYHVLDKDNIPQHIAFIMDGNGRWAKKRKMPRTYGHHEGTKTIRDVALHCNKLGVKAMTVYAFQPKILHDQSKRYSIFLNYQKISLNCI